MKVNALQTNKIKTYNFFFFNSRKKCNLSLSFEQFQFSYWRSHPFGYKPFFSRGNNCLSTNNYTCPFKETVEQANNFKRQFLFSYEPLPGNFFSKNFCTYLSENS